MWWQFDAAYEAHANGRVFFSQRAIFRKFPVTASLRTLNHSVLAWPRRATHFGNTDLTQNTTWVECCQVRKWFFFACAGDSYVIPDNNWLKQMLETSDKLKKASVIISARRVSMEKAKQLGVIIGEEIEPGIVKVKKVVEKPEKPPSNLVINAFYIFDPMIFRALEKLEFNKKGEKEVTDAIQKIIDWGFDVYATVLSSNKYYLVDIGKVETYLEAIEKFNQMTKRKQ